MPQDRRALLNETNRDEALGDVLGRVSSSRRSAPPHAMRFDAASVQPPPAHEGASGGACRQQTRTRGVASRAA